jgi:hypothetical protein
MPAKIRTPGGTVLSIAGRWSSTDNPELAQALNEVLDSGHEPGAAGQPDPDLAEAQRVVNLIGGEVIEHEPAEFEHGTVY